MEAFVYNWLLPVVAVCFPPLAVFIVYRGHSALKRRVEGFDRIARGSMSDPSRRTIERKRK